MKKNRYLKILKSQMVIASGLVIAAILCLLGTFRLSGSYNSLVWKLLDSAFQAFSVSVRSSELTSIMLALSWWGYYGTLIVWIGLGSWFAKQKNNVLVTLVVVLALGGIGLGYGMKNLVQRDRPTDNTLISETSKSFPSNHALSATVLYLAVVYFIYNRSHMFWASALSLLLAVIIIFAVGFSRIYLGVHYFSDIVGGILSGLGYVLLILGCFKLWWIGKLQNLVKSN